MTVRPEVVALSPRLILLLRVWRPGIVVITAGHLHLTEHELMFCAGSNPALKVLEIHDDSDSNVFFIFLRATKTTLPSIFFLGDSK